MDPIISKFDFEPDDDLNLCHKWGIAYQSDMSGSVPYDAKYFRKYIRYEGTEIAKKINQVRIDLVDRHYGSGPVTDIGIGSGEFIKLRPNTQGYDINPRAVAWLRSRKIYDDSFRYNAITMWDVLEHVQFPGQYLKTIPQGGFLFVCVPIFKDLENIRDSRHYRPDEHYYYYTHPGFVGFFGIHGYEMLECNDGEIKAGRDSIYSYAFRKTQAGYNWNVGQYQQLHASRHYGSSAHLHFDVISKYIISLNPKSILDYGCGRSDFVSYFWLDGRRTISKYDPAIPEYSEPPKGVYDLVLCLDVMEHIAIKDIARVLSQIRQYSQRAMFSISMKPARAHLPDGRNAHISLLSETEWMRFIREYFPTAQKIKNPYEHILIVKAF